MSGDNIQWTSEQMIENASNWSLAGDVALLNSLKKFSASVLSNTESVSANVDNLLNSLENVSLKLELAKNEFQSLRNTQFIENRVYEDDETLENDIKKAEEKEETDEDKENVIKEAISKGLEVIRKYYDRVELAVSDSEGEANENNSYVLQPKDPYADRPLPYLVGSEDWHKKWHVGLLPSESESESEKEEEVYSSGSDSEELLPKNRNLGSETSSELDFTNRNTGPVANSTFNDSQDHRRDLFHSSDDSSEQSGSLHVKTPISNEKFAEQLAAKLGDVISGKNETSENVSKPTKRTVTSNQFSKYDSLFSDEPPPLDQPDKTILPKSVQEDLFSDGKDLFSENSENNLFWNPSQQEPSGSSKKISGGQKPSASSSKAKVPRGLFDDSDSSSEEDMLTVTEKRKILNATVGSNPYMQPYKTTVPFVDDQPPEITPIKVENVTPKKKPAGGVSVLPNTSLVPGKSSTQEQQSNKNPQAIREPVKKGLGLFDESSDEEMFNSKSRTSAEPQKAHNVDQGKTFSLFDDNPPQSHQEKPKSLFDDGEKHEAILEKEHKKPAKKFSLFDDDEDFYKEEEDIFATVPKHKTNLPDLEKPTKPPNKGLFDDLEEAISPSNKKDDDLKPKEILFEEDPESLDNKTATSTKEDAIKPIKSLFEDFESEDDDLLFNISNQAILTTVKKKEAAPIAPKNDNDFVVGQTPFALERPKIAPRKFVNEITNEQKKSSVASVNKNESTSPAISHQKVEDSNNSKSGLKNTAVSEEKEEFFKVEAKGVTNLDDDKKEVLGNRRKKLGLFDSASEGSSHEDKDDKKVKIVVDEMAKTEQALDKPLPAIDVFKPVELKKRAEENIFFSGPQPNIAAAVPPPIISLFDPTPPPVDWDAGSDHSAESDTFSLTDGILERTSYNQSQPAASSLFDEAPPSLDVNDMNYSSGIGRDINVTRVETDDSSFYPHASSSRRFSSDIFSDQQSQDSFFVTKNPAESHTQVSSLGKITENSEDSASLIENLTPSGNVADFESNSSSVFETSAYDSKGEMYTTRPIPPKKPEIPPRVSRSSGNVEQKTHDDGDVSKKADIPAVKTSPGKLKHNLNINVGALLPGAAPPRSRPAIAITKPSSSDETDEALANAPSEAHLQQTPPDTVAINSKNEALDQKETASESPDSGNFESLDETRVVLHSITKDRAKIPIKRRPSTRKARQEAIRKSVTDFTLYQNTEPSFLREEVDDIDRQPPEQIVNTLLINEEEPNKTDEHITKREKLPEIKRISLVFDSSGEEKHAMDDDKSLFDTPAATDIFKSSSNEANDDDLFASNPPIFPNVKRSLLEDLLDEDRYKSSDESVAGKDKESDDSLTKPDALKETVISKSLFEDTYESKTSSSILPDEKTSNATAENTTSSTSSELTKKSDIFSEEGASSNDSDEDLFSSASRLSKKDQVPEVLKPTLSKKSGLFSDKSGSDSDSDLFGGKSNKASTDSIGRRKADEPSKKTNIFDDSGDSSEEDLFGSKKVKSASTASSQVKDAASSRRSVEVKTATVKKLENKVTDFDPLSGFK